MMDRFGFLLGDWDLEYRIPESAFSKAASGSGSGMFRKALDDRYVFFDYVSLINGQKGQAHGVFAWDEKAELYRYWWFESSGHFQTASCRFIDDQTLFMNWHDTLLIQTFRRTGPGQVTLRMENPGTDGNYEWVLEVILTRK